MATTADELAYARSWIGQLETDDEFNARFDRLLASYDERSEALDAAIEEAMRSRIAVLTMDQPGNMSVQGISVGFGSNMKAISEKLDEFRNRFGSTRYTVTELERSDPR